jgi:hypothetical protein
MICDQVGVQVVYIPAVSRILAPASRATKTTPDGLDFGADVSGRTAWVAGVNGLGVRADVWTARLGIRAV